MTSDLAQDHLMNTSDVGSHKAFALVEGAVIEGQTEPDATVTARTKIDLED